MSYRTFKEYEEARRTLEEGWGNKLKSGLVAGIMSAPAFGGETPVAPTEPAKQTAVNQAPTEATVMKWNQDLAKKFGGQWVGNTLTIPNQDAANLMAQAKYAVIKLNIAKKELAFYHNSRKSLGNIKDRFSAMNDEKIAENEKKIKQINNFLAAAIFSIDRTVKTGKVTPIPDHLLPLDNYEKDGVEKFTQEYLGN